MKNLLTSSLILLTLLLMIPQASAEFVQKEPASVEQAESTKGSTRFRKETQPPQNREKTAGTGLFFSFISLLCLVGYALSASLGLGVITIIVSLLSLLLGSAGLQSERHGIAVVAVILSTMIILLLLSTMLITLLV